MDSIGDVGWHSMSFIVGKLILEILPSRIKASLHSLSCLKVAISIFATYYAISDEPFTPQKIFVTLAYLSMIQFQMDVLPRLISMTVEAWVSNKRLTRFLTSNQLAFDAVIKTPLSSGKIINGK